IPILFLVVAGILFSVKNRAYGYIFLQVFMIAAAINMSRMLPYALLMVVLILVDIFSRAFPESYSYEKLKKLAIYPLICTFLVLFYYSVIGEREFNFRPKAMTEHFLKNNYSGNIINNYGVGGYLIYKLYPQGKVFIDGRTNILYDFE